MSSTKREKKLVTGNEDGYPYDNKSLLDSPDGEARIRRFIQMMVDLEKDPDKRSWMAELMPHLTVVSSSPATPHKGPTLIIRFEVKHIHSNAIGNLQGGCAATVFDYCSSLALALVNKPGHWWFLGVTRTLTTTLLRPVPVGEVVLIESEVVNAGRTLAHLKARMVRESDGVVLATCEHDKVNTDPPAEVIVPETKSKSESKL
jgi:acyl-coenzyme A thioesterase PaaI-like protein